LCIGGALRFANAPYRPKILAPKNASYDLLKYITELEKGGGIKRELIA
jgi:hypothetical protein